MIVLKQDEWKAYWEKQSSKSSSDFEFDRGTTPRSAEIEKLSAQELLRFIDPQRSDTILDAGCGSGANILLLQSKVERIVGIDYSAGAVERCARRISSNHLQNVEVIQGEVTHIQVADESVDKVLCLSVFQYLTNDQVRQALVEFRRVLKNRGILVLHVKNLSSLYLFSLWLVKKAKLLLGRQTKLEHFRSCRWYFSTLQSVGFEVTAYNSLNLLMVDRMPRRLVEMLQKLELKYHDKFPFRLTPLRRHGADLKIKARLNNRMTDSRVTA